MVSVRQMISPPVGTWVKVQPISGDTVTVKVMGMVPRRTTTFHCEDIRGKKYIFTFPKDKILWHGVEPPRLEYENHAFVKALQAAADAAKEREIAAKKEAAAKRKAARPFNWLAVGSTVLFVAVCAFALWSG